MVKSKPFAHSLFTFPIFLTILHLSSRYKPDQKLASDRVRFSADYFDSEFHNIIGFINSPSSVSCPFGMGTYFNTNLARARGANFAGEARITRWLSGSANYTYDSTRTLSAPTDSVNIDPDFIRVGSRLLRRPVLPGNLVLNASYWRMNWNLSGYFSGQRYDYNYPGQVIDPGYALFNLATTYRLARGFSIYGRIANLANEQYQEAYGFPALGREFRVGVKYTTPAMSEAGMPEDVLFCWSSGKDSAMALHALREERACRVTALLTTVTEEYDRISMHGVRRALLERQAESLGLPLHPVLIPPHCSNATYEERMKEALAEHHAPGAPAVAFGDIFLEDLREYREKIWRGWACRRSFPSGSATRANWRASLCGWDFAQLRFASIRASSMRPLPGANSTRFFADSPPAWTPAARTGIRARLFSMGLCLRSPSRAAPAKK